MSTELPIRDIHLPNNALWWPPAPGWWLLLALGVLVVVALLIYQKRFRRNETQGRNKILKDANELLININRNTDDDQVVKDISVMLRRTAISLHGRKDVAGLTGENWLKYLDQKGCSNDFTVGKGQLLIEQPFKKHSQYERRELVTIIRKWLHAQDSSGVLDA